MSVYCRLFLFLFFFKQKTAYERRISDWSSDVCSSDLRVLIMRALKGLEGLISVSMVNAFMGEKGWTFLPGEGVVPDSVNGAQYLYQVYLAGDPTYTGRVTIPILWDKFEIGRASCRERVCQYV